MQFQKQLNVVLLMFFDMYQRKFSIPEDPESQRKIFEAVGLQEIASVLWNMRTHLAASLARIRIKLRAPALYLLLPEHLRFRDEVQEERPIYAWINTFKVR